MAYDRHVTVGLGGTRNRLHAWSPEWLIDPPTVLSFLWVDGFEPFSRMKPPPVFLPPQPGCCRTLLRGLWHWWTMSWRHPMWLRSNILAKCGLIGLPFNTTSQEGSISCTQTLTKVSIASLWLCPSQRTAKIFQVTCKDVQIIILLWCLWSV